LNYFFLAPKGNSSSNRSSLRDDEQKPCDDNARALLVHVLLGSYEGVVADVDPAPEGEVDVGDGEQDQCNEQGKGEHLEGVEFAVGRAECGRRDDGRGSSYEEDAPEDKREMECALNQTGAAMLGEGAQLGDRMILRGDLGWGCRLDGHQRLPHVLIDLMTLFRELAAGHVGPILIDDCVGIVAGFALEFHALLRGQPFSQAIDVS
jgi:hypothetical protein